MNPNVYNTGKVLIGSKHFAARPLTSQEIWEQDLVLPTPVQYRYHEPFHIDSSTKTISLYICAALLTILTLSNL